MTIRFQHLVIGALVLAVGAVAWALAAPAVAAGVERHRSNVF